MCAGVCAGVCVYVCMRVCVCVCVCVCVFSSGSKQNPLVVVPQNSSSTTTLSLLSVKMIMPLQASSRLQTYVTGLTFLFHVVVVHFNTHP